MQDVQRRLYVATPGDGPDLSKSGQGILVFDIDRAHEFVKRIPVSAGDTAGVPNEIAGIAMSIPYQRLFLTTRQSLLAIDLKTDEVLWEKPIEGGGGRISISPDGEVLIFPSGKEDRWYFVRAENGETMRHWDGPAKSGLATFSRDGRWIFCTAHNSRYLSVLRTDLSELDHEVGPFEDDLRFTATNRTGTIGYVSIRGTRGFEIGDLESGKIIAHSIVEGTNSQPGEEYSDLGHWMTLTPDASRIWLCDTEHRFLHVFDVTTEPIQQVRSVPVLDGTNWLMFNHDGKHAYLSTGEILSTANGQIIGRLLDEDHCQVRSQQMVEIHFRDGKPIAHASRNGQTH